MAERFGGYDIDDIVVNTGELKCDHELATLLDLREAGIWDGSHEAMVAHNSRMKVRTERFFANVEPDDNPLVVYVHTAELAFALGLDILLIGSVSKSAMTQTNRSRSAEANVRDTTIRIATEQASANRVFARRYNLTTPSEYSTYGELEQAVGHVLETSGVVVTNEHTRAIHVLLDSKPTLATLLRRCQRMLTTPVIPRHARAMVARQLKSVFGAAAPQEAHHSHNHVEWARIIHAAYSATGGVVATTPSASYCKKWDESDWQAAFPMGPGNSAFALFRIQDWLGRTRQSDFESGYAWFKQTVASREKHDVKYERCAALLVMGDVFRARPEIGELATRIPLGTLSVDDFSEVGQAIHNIVRTSLTFLGHKLTTPDLAVYTYWHCLAGRVYGDLDMAEEIADRTQDRAPKYFYRDGKRSEANFDVAFSRAVSETYSDLTTKTYESFEHILDEVGNFDEFLRLRKRWVKPGSASGAPKTDVYLKLPRDRINALDEVSEAVGKAGIRVMKAVRLNKAATFEFSELPGMVEEALRDYDANAFTRHFVKHEIGKPGGRALYPTHLLHYVVTSYILYMAEKAGGINMSRLNAGASAQMDDHWYWRTTREFSTGLMLDYANFNEQHEVKHMKEIILQLKNFYATYAGLSRDMNWAINWVSDAFDKIVFEENGNYHLFTHGLLSGMRCTTWVNSVANVAYLKVLSQQIYELTGMRVLTEVTSGGDDVAAKASDIYEAMLILRVGEAMGFTFKAIKQLLGTRYYEFYRLFVSAEGVFGSLCRMLGSAVSGQWSNSVIAKFVDPATKMASVVEIARKAGRRAKLDMSMMEKMTLCAFDKWATFDEIRLSQELIHGTKATGGLGVPKADGTVYELESAAQVTVDEETELVGLPTDASTQVANASCDEVERLLGKDHSEDRIRLATKMASDVFLGNVSSARGPRTAQRVVGSSKWAIKPQIKRVLSIPSTDYATERSARFKRALDMNRDKLAEYNKMGKRYDSLSKATKSGSRMFLAEVLCREGPVCEPDKLYYWKERFTLYGCAAYLLTEDYYDTVVRLALLDAEEVSDECISKHAAKYACGLANDRYMEY